MSIFELYHENTKYSKRKNIPDFKHIGVLRSQPKIMSMLSKAFKKYPTFPQLKLDLDAPRVQISIDDAIRTRRTQREFSDEPVSFKELSRLLNLSYGINGGFKISENETQHFRMSPSAGALYPLELYPVIFNVQGMEKGIYHFNVLENSLELIKKGDFAHTIADYCCEQWVIEKAGFAILIAAVFGRTTFKYLERGYRFILLDAGHLAQNIYLAATSADASCMTVGGFYDDMMNELIGIDGLEESVVYVAVVGKTKKDTAANLQNDYL